MNNYDDYLPSLFIKFLKFLHFVNDAGEVIVLPLKFILGVLFFIYELKDYKKYQRKCLVNFCFKLTENGSGNLFWRPRVFCNSFWRPKFKILTNGKKQNDSARSKK